MRRFSLSECFESEEHSFFSHLVTTDPVFLKVLQSEKWGNTEKRVRYEIYTTCWARDVCNRNHRMNIHQTRNGSLPYYGNNVLYRLMDIKRHRPRFHEIGIILAASLSTSLSEGPGRRKCLAAITWERALFGSNGCFTLQIKLIFSKPASIYIYTDVTLFTNLIYQT